MTAVRAAVARAALGAVIVLIAIAAMLWAVFGPQGFWVLAWLGMVFVVVTGCGVALEHLGKRPRKGAGRHG